MYVCVPHALLQSDHEEDPSDDEEAAAALLNESFIDDSTQLSASGSAPGTPMAAVYRRHAFSPDRRHQVPLLRGRCV